MNIGEEILIGKMGQQPMDINDPSVDPQHAILRKTAAGVYQIEDNHSVNGVYVYGMRIKRKTVQEDTPIRLGSLGTTVGQLLQDPTAIDLGAIWAAYDAEKRQWDRKAMLVNYLRVLPSILTMALGMFVGPAMPNSRRALITISLTLIVLIISFLATDKIMAKKNQRMAEMNAEMQQKYVCPFCHNPLPLTAYSILKTKGCPHKGCSHYGCQLP